MNPEPLTEQQIRDMEPEAAVRAVMEREEVDELLAREIVQRIHHGGDTVVVDDEQPPLA